MARPSVVGTSETTGAAGVGAPPARAAVTVAAAAPTDKAIQIQPRLGLRGTPSLAAWSLGVTIGCGGAIEGRESGAAPDSGGCRISALVVFMEFFP
ncbi:MAG TPA: hypothetical protein VF395_04280 [Polyangiaceae bacterium]